MQMTFENVQSMCLKGLTGSVVLLLAACAAPDYTPQVQAAIKSGFRAEGIAGLDRVAQDDFHQLCSEPAKAAAPETAALRDRLQQAALAAIKPPADGKYLGDWKNGEKIAQSGRGATWTDKPGAENGGGCYNCHQIDRKEISHGTIGPTLWNYGKLRGNSDAIVTYTWNRLNNSKAYNACSNMPRFGHAGLLTEKQIKDLMALLLDPASPVNQ
jgi:sulfur-oxidizing protein SoxX